MQSDIARRGVAAALGLTLALAPMSLRAEELTVFTGPLGATGKIDKKLLRERMKDYRLPESA